MYAREYLPHMQTYDMIPYDLLLGLPFVSSRAETFLRRFSSLSVCIYLYDLMSSWRSIELPFSFYNNMMKFESFCGE